MQILVSGQHISVSSKLQEYVKERLNSSVKKYFDHAPSATVHFNKRYHDDLCDISIKDGTGRHSVIKSNSSCDDFYLAFDTALIKAEKQLRKYKSKLKDHSQRMKVSEITPDSVKYVISSSNNENLDHDEHEPDIDNPVIIAEKTTKIMKLSVGEAVMRMDLENLPALMFQNIKNDRINVVYYRKDGNISWIDSK